MPEPSLYVCAPCILDTPGHTGLSRPLCVRSVPHTVGSVRIIREQRF